MYAVHGSSAMRDGAVAPRGVCVFLFTVSLVHFHDLRDFRVCTVENVFVGVHFSITGNKAHCSNRF